MPVRKILCTCICGLGSSLMLQMTVEKALKAIGKEDIEVDHSGMSDVYPGSADLYICSSDTKEECEKVGPTVPIDRLTDKEEVTRKIKEYFETHE
jgi:PTS system ascorbate-specific IIB component